MEYSVIIFINVLNIYTENTEVNYGCKLQPLFKLLIDRNMKKKELAELAGVSLATITKLGKEGSTVTTDILVKICVALNCELGDIVEIVPDTTLT